jgi:hypothetical protein
LLTNIFKHAENHDDDDDDDDDVHVGSLAFPSKVEVVDTKLHAVSPRDFTAIARIP